MSDSPEYFLIFPLWTFVDSPDGDPDGYGFNYSGLPISDLGGHECLMVFTHEDFVTKIQESFSTALKGAEPIKFHDNRRFIRFLESAFSAGFATHMILDTWKSGAAAHLMPLADVIAQLTEQCRF